MEERVPDSELHKHIDYYVMHIKGFLPAEHRKIILDELTNTEWKIHQFHDPITGQLSSYDDDLSVTHETLESDQLIMPRLHGVLSRYMRVYNFPWFNSWNGYSKVKYHRYNEGEKMHLHCDHIHTIFDGERKGIPTLTMLGLLNDDFEGGDLLMYGYKKVDFKAGDLLIFPSNFMYPHEVTTITKGNRYSYVSWMW